MFYIHTPRLRRTGFVTLRIVPTLIVFVAFSATTLLSWQSASQRAHEDQQTAQAKNIAQTQNAIDTRIKTYEEILRAGSSVFAASDNVTRPEWDKVVGIFDLPDRYSGVQGVGYSKIISAAERDSLVAAKQSTDDPGFMIYPATDTNSQASLLYFAPRSDTYPQSIGYDLYSNPAGRAAMDEARDNAGPALTGKISLAQDKDANEEPGFIMYFPVYKDGALPETQSDRRAQIYGYIFAPFRATTLFNSLDETDSNSSYGYQLYAGEPKSENLLYKSRAFDNIQKQPGDLANTTTTVRFGQATWTIVFNSDSKLGSRELRDQPFSLLFGGMAFSLVAAALIYVLLATRSKALVHADETEIQEAKDELLALASHQLRTPATGVKQYVGMLREGFVGKLTKQQLNLLDKAYESNERQLTTINQMLSVARVDSGRLMLAKTKTNISKLLEDVVAEQEKTFEKQKQLVTLTLPKKPVYGEIDRQYLLMAIENVLNNAHKYTPHGGSINVRLQRLPASIVIHIEDTGVGIKDQDYPLLFKKFSRIPNEFTNKVTGSGIGLYLTKSIIETHGGSITVSSKVCGGTKFIIRLPVSGKKADETAKNR